MTLTGTRSGRSSLTHGQPANQHFSVALDVEAERLDALAPRAFRAASSAWSRAEPPRSDANGTFPAAGAAIVESPVYMIGA